MGWVLDDNNCFLQAQQHCSVIEIAWTGLVALTNMQIVCCHPFKFLTSLSSNMKYPDGLQKEVLLLQKMHLQRFSMNFSDVWYSNF